MALVCPDKEGIVSRRRRGSSGGGCADTVLMVIMVVVLSGVGLAFALNPAIIFVLGILLATLVCSDSMNKGHKP